MLGGGGERMSNKTLTENGAPHLPSGNGRFRSVMVLTQTKLQVLSKWLFDG